MGEAIGDVIRLSLTKHQKRVKIHRRLHIHCQDNAMKKSAFYFWTAAIREGGLDLANEGSSDLLVHLTVNMMNWLEADLQEIPVRR
jgi:hypothetical protein